jgi:hypothetical protein
MIHRTPLCAVEGRGMEKGEGWRSEWDGEEREEDISHTEPQVIAQYV